MPSVHFTSGNVNGADTTIVVLSMRQLEDKRQMVFSTLDCQLMLELFEANERAKTNVWLSATYLKHQFEDVFEYYGVYNRIEYLLDRKVVTLASIKAGDKTILNVGLTAKGRFICRRYLKNISWDAFEGLT